MRVRVCCTYRILCLTTPAWRERSASTVILMLGKIADDVDEAIFSRHHATVGDLSYRALTNHAPQSRVNRCRPMFVLSQAPQRKCVFRTARKCICHTVKYYAAQYGHGAPGMGKRLCKHKHVQLNSPLWALANLCDIHSCCRHHGLLCSSRLSFLWSTRYHSAVSVLLSCWCAWTVPLSLSSLSQTLPASLC